MSIFGADRRWGQALRERLSHRPAVDRIVRASGSALAPAFEGLVGGLIVARRTRWVGVRAGAAAAAASLAAKGLRDTIARPRPGERAEGGFPSRHAAAATAIVRSISRSSRVAGVGLASVAMVGLVGRVAASDHDPADIVAGVAVGLGTESGLERVRRGLASWRSPT